ncbi:hypothetical protein Rsub_11667 [Raphidocelis subcapitata]|uniref:Protein kinase domain-containing protein n=1 Tax=Raphidocelis subcapitata TaxID=307507 RepID=A0A2V0PKX6_9CHLO|nr:hypothetical protein Rsub_11667 [Raphidocelis subcapitata]|eukprot:GBF98673.1 hypothetical protein Rsub_11667 [Raphidocelis subcapitata]
MPGGKHRNKHHYRHGGFSDDDESDGTSSGSGSGGRAPAAPAPPAPPSAAAAAGPPKWQAPAGCHVGAELTPQQVAAAISGRRAKLLGSGGFGKVHAVDLPGLGRVALKTAAPGCERALAAEALYLRRAAHPAVVRAVASCWAPGGAAALALECVPGGPLDARIAQPPGARGALGWRARLRAAYQVAAALAHLHGDLGIVHCDVKPGNVLLDAAGNAVLIDLGVARPVVGDAAAAAAATAAAKAPAARGGRPGAAAGSGAAAHLRALAAGVACGGVAQVHGWAGTPGYVDPLFEQLAQFCAGSDVYSLGLIMVQLLLDVEDPREAKRIAQHQIKSGEMHHCVEGWPRDSALAFGTLALRAANAGDRDARPSAAELAARLRELLLAAGDCGAARLAPGTLRLASPPVAGAAPAAAAPRVVALELELAAGGAVAGTATVLLPQPPHPAGASPAALAGAAAAHPGPEPQRAALSGTWAEATGELTLTVARVESGEAKAAVRWPAAFAGRFADGQLTGQWTYAAAAPAKTAAACKTAAAAYWYIASKPAGAPAEAPNNATQSGAVAAAAAALAEGIAAGAAAALSVGSGSRRCSRDAIVERPPSVVRAL